MVNSPGTQLTAREPTYARYPAKSDIGGGRWYTTHRNWHISTGDEDFIHPKGAVICQHDADDKPLRTFRARTLEEAAEVIDAMPDYGDWDGDYD